MGRAVEKSKLAGSNMLFPLVLLFILRTISGKPTDSCCSTKTVGNSSYTLVSMNDTSVATTYGCKSNCVYEEDAVPGSRFCFAVGNLPITCTEPNICSTCLCFYGSPCCELCKGCVDACG